jgi:ribosomal subunit interface protein
MLLPIQITFHGMERSDTIEAAVRDKAQHLERFSADITSCRVGLDLMPRPHHAGSLFGVRIDLTLPGHELVVDRVENEDVHVALREAFDDMRRQLEAAVQRRRGY